MSEQKRVFRLILNVILPLVLALAIGWYFYSILSRKELWDTPLTVRWPWLVGAGILYLVAHSIWGAYWTSLLRNQGLPVSYALGWRGYFISQYGKYIPGKVWVILIRVAMLSKVGASKLIVGVTATYETLISMGSGALIGVLLLSVVSADQLQLGNLTWWLLPMALLPLGLGQVNRFLAKRAERKHGPDTQPIPHISTLMLIRGIFQASIGWILLGISLWMTMQGLQPETTPLTWDLLFKLIAINALAYVLGFIALFMPAGGGVREFALQKLLAMELTPTMGANPAILFSAIVSLVIRLVWTISELMVALLLQRFVKIEISNQIQSNEVS